MGQSKCINQKKIPQSSHCFYDRYAALWNIKISCRYHSGDTQQTPTQNKKIKIICFARSYIEPDEIQIEPDEVKVSYDVTNLYLSIPIDKAIDVILQQLSEGYEYLKTRTKLTLINIQ